MHLTTEQREVVWSDAKTQVVKACPGAGKTTMLVEIAKTWLERDGLDPSHLLVMTFTRKSAADIRERLLSRIGNKAIPIRTGTFHSICLSMVRYWHEALGFPSRNIVLADELDADNAMKAMIRLTREVGITDMKRAVAGSLDVGPVAIAAADQYRRSMRREGSCDYSMLISEALDLLKTEHADQVRLLGRYVLVDEAQDTDARQHQFYEMLAPDRLVIVGDVDQLIYEWRGADPLLMDRVLQARAGERMYLTLNHRSAPQIVAVAEKVRRMMGATGPEQTPVRKDVGLATTVPESGVAMAVAGETGTVGVLCRTNDQTGSMSAALTAAGVQNELVGVMRRAMETPLIRAACAYLCLPFVKHSGALLDRIAAAEGWNPLVAPRIKAVARRDEKSLFKVALEQVHTLGEFYRRFTGDIEADAAACLMEMKDRLQTEDAVTEEAFLACVHEYVTSAGPDGDLADMLAYISDGGAPASTERVQVMTVHAAKGLEFDSVFIVGLQDRRWPHTPRDIPDLRVLYVAVTRARSRLFFVQSGPSGVIDELRPLLL